MSNNAKNAVCIDDILSNFCGGSEKGASRRAK
jgi:hypothetical protein